MRAGAGATKGDFHLWYPQNFWIFLDPPCQCHKSADFVPLVWFLGTRFPPPTADVIYWSPQRWIMCSPVCQTCRTLFAPERRRSFSSVVEFRGTINTLQSFPSLSLRIVPKINLSSGTTEKWWLANRKLHSWGSHNYDCASALFTNYNSAETPASPLCKSPMLNTCCKTTLSGLKIAIEWKIHSIVKRFRTWPSIFFPLSNQMGMEVLEGLRVSQSQQQPTLQEKQQRDAFPSRYTSCRKSNAELRQN